MQGIDFVTVCKKYITSEMQNAFSLRSITYKSNIKPLLNLSSMRTEEESHASNLFSMITEEELCNYPTPH